MMYLGFMIAPLLAGLIQGVVGFGGGIITMLIFPLFVSIPVGAGITSALGIPLCLSMVIRYRREVNVKMALLPALLYNIISSFVISYSVYVDQITIKKIFGVFLILLCLYYLFISKNVQNKKLSLPMSIVCIAISATCDGLFGIGGPLMVLYFMSMISGTHAYLGTIQLFFWTNSMYNTALRFYKGILLPEHFALLAVGTVAILIGGAVAGKIVDRLNVTTMRKLIYIMIGIGGVINLFG